MVNNLTFCVFFRYTLYKIYFWCSRCPMNVSSWSKAFFSQKDIVPREQGNAWTALAALRILCWGCDSSFHFISSWLNPPYNICRNYGSFFGGGVAPFGSQIVRLLRWDCFAPSIRKGTLVCCPRGLDRFFLGREEAVGAGWLRTPIRSKFRSSWDVDISFGQTNCLW